MAEPVARSPIAVTEKGRQVSNGGTSLTLSDLSSLAKVLCRSDQAGLFGVDYGQARRDEHGNLVVGSAPDEWLLVGPPDTSSTLADSVPRAGFTVVVDITHGRAMMRLSGDEAALMLAKVCAIDFGDHMAPDGAAFRAPVAGVVTDIIRDDRQLRSYLLHCERSSGQYLWDVLLDAGAEFGIKIEDRA